MIQSGVFLGRLLDPLLKIGLPLMKNAINVAKSVLISLGLAAAGSTADAEMQKIFLGSGNNNTILIITSEEMKYIIKIVKSLEDSSFFILVKQFKMKLKYNEKDSLVCCWVH